MKAHLEAVLLSLLTSTSVLSAKFTPQKISGTRLNISNVCQIDFIPPTEALKNSLAQVESYLTNRYGPPCKCGGTGNWEKIADVGLSGGNASCPGSWHFIDGGTVRGCGRTTETCASTTFSAAAQYSKVCGQARAIQFGTPDAFHQSIVNGEGIDGPYVDGVSITHGPQGSRQHIWSFAAANSEATPYSGERCQCSDNITSWPYSLPSYIQQNYFCDSGQESFSYQFQYFPSDPLWDGLGCGGRSSCCDFNSPPWFCTDLAGSTNDDIEVRICGNNPVDDENILLTRLQLYIQ